MNIAVYLFGNFRTGYSQYPTDYTSSIFHSFNEKAGVGTQLAIHREGDLMYYAFLRKMEDERYFGICCVLNGMLFTQVDSLFKLFEETMSRQIARGTYIRFADDGSITTGDSVITNKEEYNLLAEELRAKLESIPSSPLPSVSYANSNNSVKEFCIEDSRNIMCLGNCPPLERPCSSEEIVEASHKFAFTYIYKWKGYDSAQTNSYKGIIAKHKRTNDELQNRCNELSNQLTKTQRKQRNTTWVSILGVIVIIFGVILWNQVLFPSEVTSYETGEFVYYGPLNNDQQPNGVGVAIYPTNDKQKRKFYIGKFVNGKRQDNAAMLLYQNGDYYYGSMNDDKWGTGILYMNTDNSHFSGEFQNNKPYNGEWFEHKSVMKVTNGEEKIR